MPVTNEDLEAELAYVTNPAEQQHIRNLWAEADPLMQDISVSLIKGDNNKGDQLTNINEF